MYENFWRKSLKCAPETCALNCKAFTLKFCNFTKRVQIFQNRYILSTEFFYQCIFIYFSLYPYSGTTGLSKGVKLSHKNIVSNSVMINSDTGNGAISTQALGDNQDVLPCVLPFFHIYGLTCTLLSKLAQGCKIVALPKFTPELYLNALDKHAATVLYLVPPISEFFKKNFNFFLFNEFFKYFFFQFYF